MLQRKFRGLAIFILITLALCVLSAPNAVADSLTYDLISQNGALTGSGPYVQVTINLTSSTMATVTFDSLDTNGYTYLMSSNGAADINVNAASFTLSGLTFSNSIAGFSAGPVVDDGSKNISTFGTFNQTTKGGAGFTNSSTEISFTLTDISGTWSSAANVTTPNNDGQILGAHGFECKDPCTTTEGAANTGYVSDAVLVPEPSSSSLIGALGVGLFGFGLLRRRLPAFSE
jgi:hypothetical protein